MLTAADVVALPTVAADSRIVVGAGEGCWGDLYLPAGAGPFPVLILIHGGCWQAAYDLAHVSPLADALRRRGLAVWSIEYRRIGHPGRAWPDTLRDVAAAADHVRALAETYPLNLQCVVAMGHSAGGHLALWLAARGRIPAGSPLHAPAPLALRGVVGLAPIPDLEAALAQGICGDSARQLLAATPEEAPQRYAAASPAALLPLSCPAWIVAGKADAIVPPAYLAAFAARAGAGVTLSAVPDAGHFELIVPDSVAWPALTGTLAAALH